MIRFASRDSVAVTGALVGLVSLLPGWLTLKSSRIASGESLSLWTGMGWPSAIIISGLWLACLILALSAKDRRNAAMLGIAANLQLIAISGLGGLAAGRLLEGQAAFARVAAGAGIWVSLVAAYVIIFAARQRLKDSPLWRNIILWSGMAVIVVFIATGWLNSFSVMREYQSDPGHFAAEFWQHLRLFSTSVLIGVVLSIPLGIWASRRRSAEKPIFFIANITQTVPSLALFGLLIAPLSTLSLAVPALREAGFRGVGATPAIIALVIYSMLPVVSNTYAGLRQVEPAVIDAGSGMGMSHLQVFWQLEAPLATPIVLEGVRTASVQAVGNTTVAALIGAGGLGVFVFDGLGQAASDLILLGVIPAIALAMAVDAFMRLVIRLATPAGLRR